MENSSKSFISIKGAKQTVIVPGRLYYKTNSNKFPSKYFECGQMNIVRLMWAKGSGTAIRPIAALNVGAAGSILAKFLTYMEEKLSTDMSKTCIISFGLGAGVAGHAGRKMGNVSCILGLDPAMNLYSRNLHRTDAQYVQVIHSSAVYGTIRAIGDADFYLNGRYLGLRQPGCSDYDFECMHLYSSEVYFRSLCESNYTGCRKHAQEDCGYIMGGEPLHIYKGEFEITVSD